MIRVEVWCGHDVRFIEIDGEWWAVIKDVCEALENEFNCPNYIASNVIGDDLVKKIKVDDEWELVTNELGIYRIMLSSGSIEARKFRRWSATVMQKLRHRVGLEPYEVMRMMEPDIQDDIDHILDTLFWDEETGKLMQSVTVQGGDVEQVEFE